MSAQKQAQLRASLLERRPEQRQLQLEQQWVTQLPSLYWPTKAQMGWQRGWSLMQPLRRSQRMVFRCRRRRCRRRYGRSKVQSSSLSLRHLAGGPTKAHCRCCPHLQMARPWPRLSVPHPPSTPALQATTMPAWQGQQPEMLQSPSQELQMQMLKLQALALSLRQQQHLVPRLQVQQWHRRRRLLVSLLVRQQLHWLLPPDSQGQAPQKQPVQLMQLVLVI